MAALAFLLWLVTLLLCVVEAVLHQDELRGAVFAVLAVAVVQLGRD